MDETKEHLKELYYQLREEMRAKWNRDIPFGELLFDRWERSNFLGFGQKSSVYHNSYIYGDVSVGEHTWIGPFTLLDGTGKLTIGDYCSISAGVQIYTHDTVAWALSGGEAKYEYAPVSIGNRVHIGAQTVIVKGVTIGTGCIVGACSFVNRDIPPNSIAFGVPAKVRGKTELDEEGAPIFSFDQSVSGNVLD